MTKLEFILALNERLSVFSKEDVRERINFYSEMIEDRVEEGISEEDAVAAIGSVDEIVAQIKGELSPTKETVKPQNQGLGAWEIVLLVLGFPLWFPLLITAVAVAFSIFVTLWSVIISLWSVFALLAVCAFSAVFSGAVLAFGPSALLGFAMIGAGLVLTGASILFFFVCRAASAGTVWLTKMIVRGIKRCFTKKEAA